MDITSINRLNLAAPVSPGTTSQDWTPDDRQLIAAVQRLNETEWLGQGRELTYRRDQHTGRLVIQIRERQTGEVVDQIPPESVLKLLMELQQELNIKD